MSALPAGRHYFRGDDGYEAARRGTVWNQRVPERYPDVIVQAVDAGDIGSAILYAKANGHKVSIRSSGHSFSANHLRDGAVLLDVSRIDHATIDADKGLAVVGPGKGGSVLMAELEAQGLFFPGGHCKGVCVGGYLLQGGYAGTAVSSAPRVRASSASMSSLPTASRSIATQTITPISTGLPAALARVFSAQSRRFEAVSAPGRMWH